VSSRQPARTGARRTRSGVVAVLVLVSAGFVGAIAYESLAPSSPSLASPSLASPSLVPRPLGTSSSAPSPIAAAPPARPPSNRLRGGHEGAVGEADGVVPHGLTVFDDEVPAVADLDPALLGALRQAATDAARAGVTFYVTSGWRSPAYQQQLLREAVSKYGSLAEAARWVASPKTSAHVSGDAVDMGSAAAAWLSRHGARYGLCEIYRNEPWHYELRPEAIDRGCPVMYADPTHDPRMQH
jgi:hypothetical protein